MSSPYRTVTERLTRRRGAALLVLRVVVGWLFILHAIMKFQLGIPAFQAAMLTPAHVPLAGLVAPVVPVIELGAGILLVLGLLTRVAAAASVSRWCSPVSW
jgi:putative oxidoreductase